MNVGYYRAGLVLWLCCMSMAWGEQPPGRVADSLVMGRPDMPAWTWRRLGPTAETFKVEIAGFRSEVTSDGHVITMPGQAHAGKAGDPDLPFVAALCPGLRGFAARVEWNEPVWRDITNVAVAPVGTRILEDVTTNSPTCRTERISSKTVYGADEFWPQRIARVEEAWAGTQKIVRVECSPIQYNPVRKIVRYTSVVEGRLVFEPEKASDIP